MTSPTAVISVRGTVFDVVVQDDDGTTFVTVDEGEVGGQERDRARQCRDSASRRFDHGVSRPAVARPADR